MLCVIFAMPANAGDVRATPPPFMHGPLDPLSFEYRVDVFLTKNCRLAFVIIDNAGEEEPEILPMTIEQFAVKMEAAERAQMVVENANPTISAIRGVQNASLLFLGTTLISRLGKGKSTILRKIYETRFRTKIGVALLVALAWGSGDYYFRDDGINLGDSEAPPMVRNILIQFVSALHIFEQVRGEIRNEVNFPRSLEEGLGEVPLSCSFRKLNLPDSGINYSGVQAFKSLYAF